MRIHKEGHRIILNSILILLTLAVILYATVGFSTVSHIVVFFLFLIAILIVRFFREPERKSLNDNSIISAPADGTIVIIKNVFEPEYLKKECIQVSIFMSVFNVHVNWFPIKGAVSYYKYHPGKYLVAMHPKSSEKNERTTIVVKKDGSETEILFRQIAGLIARRIVCYAKVGEEYNQADQVGFIKFGSRVDLFLPLGTEVLVKKGEKVTGCHTAIARLAE